VERCLHGSLALAYEAPVLQRISHLLPWAWWLVQSIAALLSAGERKLLPGMSAGGWEVVCCARMFVYQSSHSSLGILSTVDWSPFPLTQCLNLALQRLEFLI
jgi:hypothetical protein